MGSSACLPSSTGKEMALPGGVYGYCFQFWALNPWNRKVQMRSNMRLVLFTFNFMDFMDFQLILGRMHNLMSQQTVVSCTWRTLIEKDQVFVFGFIEGALDLCHIELL